MKAHQLRGNTCVLALGFSTKEDLERHAKTCEDSKLYQELRTLRLFKDCSIWNPFKRDTLYWHNKTTKSSTSFKIPLTSREIFIEMNDANEKAIESEEKKALADSVKSLDIDIFKESPVKITALSFNANKIPLQGHYLIFSWHHAFIDAHGAEMIFCDILNTKGSEISLEKYTVSDNNNKQTFSSCFPSFQIFKKEILRLAKDSTAIPVFKGKKKTSHEFSYHPISLNQKETRKAKLRLEDEKLATFPACGYLASISRAIAKNFNEQNSKYFVCVPHDTRKNRTLTYSLGNQLSLFFYSINPSQKEFSSRKRLAEELVSQTASYIHKGIHKLTEEFYYCMNSFPYFIRRFLYSLTADGDEVSFYFSNTNDSLNTFDKLLGESLISATHFPPHFNPPGISFVLSEFRDQMQIMIISNQERSTLKKLESFLREEIV